MRKLIPSRDELEGMVIPVAVASGIAAYTVHRFNVDSDAVHSALAYAKVVPAVAFGIALAVRGIMRWDAEVGAADAARVKLDREIEDRRVRRIAAEVYAQKNIGTNTYSPA